MVRLVGVNTIADIMYALEYPDEFEFALIAGELVIRPARDEGIGTADRQIDSRHERERERLVEDLEAVGSSPE